MSRLDFSTYSAEIQEAHRNVLNNQANWAIFSYGPNTELKFIESGDGGLEELKDEFEGSKIQYAFARVVEPISQLPRFVLISWVRCVNQCGDGVPVARKGLFNMHVNDVAAYFKGYHVHINARHEEDIEPATVMKRVNDSCGAKYSVQAHGTNPSAAASSIPPRIQPVAPITKPSSNPVSKPSYNPAIKASNTSAKPPPVTKPSYTSATPAPLQKEEPKPLFSAASSTYEPIKTNPKPLQSSFQQASQQNASYQPVKTNPKPLQNKLDQPSKIQSSNNGSVSNIAASFNQPGAASSSYQPIKLEPKPLYGEGVATMAFTPDSRRSSNAGILV